MPTRVGEIYQFHYPLLCRLRQQAPYKLARSFPLSPRREIRDPHTNGMRLPELDKSAIKVHPVFVQLVLHNRSGVILMVEVIGEGVTSD